MRRGAHSGNCCFTARQRGYFCHAPRLHDRVDDEALAALPRGTGPGALRAAPRRRRPNGASGNGDSESRDTDDGAAAFSFRLRAGRSQSVETSTVKIGIVGADGLGRGVELAASRRHHSVIILGRPQNGRHPTGLFRGIEVLVDTSDADYVLPNLLMALDARCRRIVIAATPWGAGIPLVNALLCENEAAAVAADGFTLGFADFACLIAPALRSLPVHTTFAPGTADLSTAWQRDRSLGATGMQDRDHTTIADGILAAAEWLARERRPPGVHLVHSIADELVGRGQPREA